MDVFSYKTANVSENYSNQFFFFFWGHEIGLKIISLARDLQEAAVHVPTVFPSA